MGSISGVVDRIENGLAVIELVDTEGQPAFVYVEAGDLREGQRVVLFVTVRMESKYNG